MLALFFLFFWTQAKALTLKAVHWEDAGMIESSLANTFVGSEHKSKAFNWHALWERKKRKIMQMIVQWESQKYIQAQKHYKTLWAHF